MIEYTSIGVSPETKERLAMYKEKGDTFDDILNTLMDRIKLINRIEEDI